MKGRILLTLITAFFAFLPITAFGGGLPVTGAVYAMSNAPEGNEIVVFDRDLRGRLTLQGSYATAGLGTGGNIDPLGSQGSLILSKNKRWLIAVNAGSNDISVFRVRRHGLELVDNVDSGGSFPVSVTLDRNLVYVLNAGQDGNGPNIAGFQLNRYGELTPMDGSTRELGPGGFHQVGFNPRGDALVISQGDGAGVNAINVFGIDEDGYADDAATVSSSSGVVPLGFIFDWRGHLLVSEAGSGAVSSYAIQDDLTLAIISASVPNGNLATCWIAGTWWGGVFTSNTGSDNISIYKAKAGTGKVQLKDADAASGDKPIDMATTRDGRFLYVLNAGNGTVGAFRISPFGGIKNIGEVGGLPPVFGQGIAVR